MGDATKISWTDRTLNPWIGCDEVVLHKDGVRVPSECDNCYARELAHNRMGFNGVTKPVVWGPARSTPRHRTAPATWHRAYAWNTHAREHGRELVFCASLSDVFEFHPDLVDVRRDLWNLIEECHHLDFQLLTKRPMNIKRMVPQSWLQDWPLNVWVGTSTGTQEAFNLRVPHLVDLPAQVKFLSVEPLLEDVDVEPWLYGIDGAAINWIITGGESGPGHRAWNDDWARHVRDACVVAGVPFFFKQAGALRPGTGALLDGRYWHQFPNTLVGPVGGVRAMADAEIIDQHPSEEAEGVADSWSRL